MGILRNTYLIGPDGQIARIWEKVKVAGHAEEVLAGGQGTLSGALGTCLGRRCSGRCTVGLPPERIFPVPFGEN